MGHNEKWSLPYSNIYALERGLGEREVWASSSKHFQRQTACTWCVNSNKGLFC